MLHYVRFEHQGLLIELNARVIDFAPGALLCRRLHVEQLTLERGRVRRLQAIRRLRLAARVYPAAELPALQLPLSLS